ncbi:MAG TPA: hypothetical protein VMI75_17905 [Polyangiaceae bacterium]|nr:hypothetical protein [Polyangiaceae bacterium]
MSQDKKAARKHSTIPVQDDWLLPEEPVAPKAPAVPRITPPAKPPPPRPGAPRPGPKRA